MIDAAKSIEDAVRQGCAILGMITVTGADSESTEYAITMQKSWDDSECVGLFAMVDGLELDTELILNPEFYAQYVEFGQVVCGPIDWLTRLMDTAFRGVGFNAVGYLNGKPVRLWKSEDVDAECETA